MIARRTQRSLAMILVVTSLAGGHAFAADPRASAAASFREAQAAFARRDFAAAAAAFEQTARTAPHPATWLNAAEAWMLRGDWARAAEDCDRALELDPADEAIRREAERRLGVALGRVGTLEVVGAGGFGVRVDAEPVATLPVRRRLAPGPHRATVVELATGREAAHEWTAEAGKVHRIEAPAASVPAPVATPKEEVRLGTPPASSKSPPVLSWVLFGTGAALGIGAGALGYVTLNAKDDFEANPTRETLDTFRADRLATNVALGAALVAIAAGAAFWIWSPRDAKEARARVHRSDHARFVGPWRLP